jgi:N-acetylneuraminate synthase
MLNEIRIDNRDIGLTHPPYIIAEISGNHNGDINRAKTLIKVAKESGACAVKLQTYTADSLTIDSDSDQFIIKEGTWAGRRLYDLYTEAHTPWDWFGELFSYAKDIGITIFSSPFDLKAVELLEELDAPAYKIASNELVDWPLVEAVVRTGKPLIISTGAASKQDIADTLEFIKEIGGNQVAVLHCISAYPALPEDSNLGTMVDLKGSYGVLAGLSDHTLGTATSIAAVAMGACIIEKHYTLDRNDGGPDSSFSLEPAELKVLCHDALWAWKSVQGIKYGDETNLEKKGIFTRQFWSITDIDCGSEISAENVKSIRAPANSGGISPKQFRWVFGRKAKVKIPKHTPINLDNI